MEGIGTAFGLGLRFRKGGKVPSIPAEARLFESAQKKKRNCCRQTS